MDRPLGVNIKYYKDLCITSKHQALCNGGIVGNEVYPTHEEVPVARTAPMHCLITRATTQQSCCSHQQLLCCHISNLLLKRRMQSAQ